MIQRLALQPLLADPRHGCQVLDAEQSKDSLANFSQEKARIGSVCFCVGV